MTDVANRRLRILNAAAQLLHHYGFHKTTVADIAKAAKVGVGSVYLEFSSKDELVAALAEQRHHVVVASMREAAEAPGPWGEKLLEMLQARLRALWALAAEGHHALDLLSCCPAVHKVRAQFRADEERLVADVVAAGQVGGEFDSELDPEATAKVLLAVDDALAPPQAHGDPKDSPGILPQAHRLLLGGLRIRP